MEKAAVIPDVTSHYNSVSDAWRFIFGENFHLGYFRADETNLSHATNALIDELARAGTGIILISSELSELLNLSTRILVLREGRIAGEISRAAATQDDLLRLMSGLKRNMPPPTSSIRTD